MTPGLYEVVTTRSGAKSIRNVVLDETMHNPVGPWEEANTLYIGPSRLKERLSTNFAEDLVVYDVGLGAAANAIAAIRAAHNAFETGESRRLHIVSFEKDLELLAFAIANADAFHHFEGLVPALKAVLHDHHWTSPCGRIVWDLRAGDFLALIDHETTHPHIIFHDPYSPASNPEMWNLRCFQKLYGRIKPSDEPTTLFTYSIATPVRAAMVLAGFYGGHGPRTGLKHETTQASTHIEALEQPFGERWLNRWIRSHTKYPLGTPPDEFEAVTQKMMSHPQFVGVTLS